MRNTRFAKWWPLAALGGAGLLVMIGTLVSLIPAPAVRVVHRHAVRIPIAMPSVAFARPTHTLTLSAGADADSDSTAFSGDSTGNYDYNFGGDKNDIVRMGEDIEIGPDQVVKGDVVAIGGRATIRGHVHGDVVSVGGGIHLESGCVVDGDAVVVGGVMDREEGAIVRGQNVSVAAFPKGLGRWWWPRMDHHARAVSGASSALCVGRDVLRYVAFFVIGMILCLALPHRRGIVRSTIRSRFWLSLLVGFGSLIGLLVAVVLLCITCIGIVVAIPGFFASLVVIAAAGAVAFALLGELITRRQPGDGASWLWSFALGLLPIFVIHLLGRMLVCSSDGGGGELLGKAILGICKTAWAVLIFAGFGALILSRLGSRDPSLPPPPPTWAGFPMPPSSGSPIPPTPPGQVPPAYGPGAPQAWTPYGQGGTPPPPPPAPPAPPQGSTWRPPIPPKPPDP